MICDHAANVDLVGRRDIAALAKLDSFSNHDYEYEIIDFMPDVTYERESQVFYGNIANVQVFASNAADDRTLMLFGDSYSVAMSEYLIKSFQKVIWVTRDFGDMTYSQQNLVEQYQPDIIVMELVGRGVSKLMKENYPF